MSLAPLKNAGILRPIRLKKQFLSHPFHIIVLLDATKTGLLIELLNNK
jgi:hypothetical protein